MSTNVKNTGLIHPPAENETRISITRDGHIAYIDVDQVDLEQWMNGSSLLRELENTLPTSIDSGSSKIDQSAVDALAWTPYKIASIPGGDVCIGDETARPLAEALLKRGWEIRPTAPRAVQTPYAQVLENHAGIPVAFATTREKTPPGWNKVAVYRAPVGLPDDGPEHDDLIEVIGLAIVEAQSEMGEKIASGQWQEEWPNPAAEAVLDALRSRLGVTG
jgi:hypothetical protein